MAKQHKTTLMAQVYLVPIINAPTYITFCPEAEVPREEQSFWIGIAIKEYAWRYHEYNRAYKNCFGNDPRTKPGRYPHTKNDPVYDLFDDFFMIPALHVEGIHA